MLSTWETWERLLVKEYRDCIQHFVPVSGTVATAEAARVQEHFTVRLRIPDNPEAKSHKSDSHMQDN